jgi:hypothetical protein
MVDTFYTAFRTALQAAANYNQVDQARPVAVLWPDKERQWGPLLSRLQADLPVLALGPFNPAARSGPAIWLRCMVDRALPEADWPADQTPILYLPGVSKQELRAVKEAPDLLKPLAELQYRGVLWTQKNGKDWTIAAFLQSADKGLNIEIGGDNATREAMQRALEKLADEPVEELRKDAPLTAARFNLLLNPDQVRSLLQWMNAPAKHRATLTDAEWSAFRADCKQQYDFDPEKEGEITAAAHLGGRMNAWNTVWNRYAEAPRRYPHLPDLLRKGKPAQSGGLFYDAASWPQENEAGETAVRNALLTLDGKMPGEVRAALDALEKEHGKRRNWVWAELERSPLANVIPSLIALAEATQAIVGGAAPAEIAAAYAAGGWKADASVLDALAGVETAEDVAAVKAIIRTLYQPWLQSCAAAFQAAVAQQALPGPAESGAAPAPKAGRCLLFADGLRFDVGRKLAEALERKGLSVATEWRFTALPGVTPTAKPAVSPVAALLAPGGEFGTTVISDGAKVTADILRRELEKAGYPALLSDAVGNPAASAWTECGSIDSYGHAQGWKLARRVNEEVRELAERVQALLAAGWQEIRIVTDHGWLLLPGGLPGVELPLHLTDARKGRCARIKAASSFDGQTVPWRWDPDVRIAVAPGIGCYVSGKEYEHGGLSPQECVVPMLTVTANATTSVHVSIRDAKWIGLRCRIQIACGAPGLIADIRTKAADAGTSLVEQPKALRDGQASLVVIDDSRQGEAAAIVILNAEGALLAQVLTTVGG